MAYTLPVLAPIDHFCLSLTLKTEFQPSTPSPPHCRAQDCVRFQLVPSVGLSKGPWGGQPVAPSTLPAVASLLVLVWPLMAAVPIIQMEKLRFSQCSRPPWQAHMTTITMRITHFGGVVRTGQLHSHPPGYNSLIPG